MGYTAPQKMNITMGSPPFEDVFPIPTGSWLTETENRFMEPLNTIRFVHEHLTPPPQSTPPK